MPFWTSRFLSSPRSLVFVAIVISMLWPQRPYASDYTNVIKKVMPSVVRVTALDKTGNVLATGTGFFINANGDVITNMHVISNSHSVTITTNKGNSFPVEKVEQENATNDIVRLAVYIPSKLVKFLPVSNKLPEVGDKIIVIGSPMGLDQSVSDGIVSSIRNISDNTNIIQITAPISPGSSGSPVVNDKGQVIGIASFQVVKGQNLNFAVPVSIIKELKTSHYISISDWSENNKLRKDDRKATTKDYLFDKAFRQLPWGIAVQQASQVYPDLTLLGIDADNVSRYKRSFEDLEVFGPKCVSIVYYFYDERFGSVGCGFEGKSALEVERSVKMVYDKFKELYGNPEIVHPKENTTSVTWHVGNVTLEIHKVNYPTMNVGFLFIKNKHIYRKEVR